MKLITWNVQWCRGLDGRVDPGRIVATARALADFDVLCLQEVADGYPGLGGHDGSDQPAALAQALPGFTAVYAPAVDEAGDRGRRWRFGNLILTRLAVLERWLQRLPWPARPKTASMPRACNVIVVDAPQIGPVRIMTTHLEYFDDVQRLAQARALRELHREACEQADQPPSVLKGERATPYQPRPHTRRTLLCGDFNAAADGPEHAAITAPFAGPGGTRRLVDAWQQVHPGIAQPPTFRCFDKTYGPDPIACDFVFVSDEFASRVDAVRVDGLTQASDHQPVLVEIR